MNVFKLLSQKKIQNEKSFAVLIDPDKEDLSSLSNKISFLSESFADLIFVGGSFVSNSNLDRTCQIIKESSKLPCVLFPGNYMQISNYADAILFLSLISGRNSDYLIGQHVLASPLLENTTIEVIPTSYLLVEGGTRTSVEYISNTLPIPRSKHELIKYTALAGMYQGHKLVYLDAGSGAKYSVLPESVELISRSISSPIIVGGGIKDASIAKTLFQVGADVIVLGNSLEGDYKSITKDFVTCF